MTFIDRVRPKAGPLLGPAQRLICDAPGGVGRDFGGGTRGIVALAERLEAFCAQEAQDDEDAFVEAAGALLGLILIDHVRRAHHVAREGVHRIRLGAHGFFDPFQAVQSALLSDNVRRQLAREVQRAEAEAMGRGPLSTFVASFVEQLEVARPDLRIVEQFETRLQLSDGSEVDVARSVRATLGEPSAARSKAALRLVQMLPRGSSGQLSFAQVAPRLLPRLCQRDAFASLQGGQVRGRVHVRPFGHDVPGLGVAVIIEHEGRSRYAREDEVQHWRAEGGDAERQALTNLAARSRSARFVHIETPHGPLVMGKTGDGLDSARLLLPGLFDVLHAELGTRMRVAVPHRDLLLASPDRPPALVEALARRAADDFARAPHPLLAEPLYLDAAGLRARD